MKKQFIVKIIATIMAICLAFSSFSFSATAEDTGSLGLTREELEQQLEEVNQKLDELGEESKETEEYLSVLNEKIGYLRAQYNSAVKELEAIEGKIDSLEKDIDRTEKEIDEIKIVIADLEYQIKELNKAFEETYTAYCSRIRALYISGSSNSILTLLLTSTGLSDLLVRYEMVNAVTNQDYVLMKQFKKKSNKIVKKADELKEKNEELSETQKELTQNQRDLTTQKAELAQKQSELEKQKAELEAQQKEANDLLEELNEQTKEYGEFRDMTQEELDEIDEAIAEADRKYQESLTTTTTTTSTTTTTTTQPSTNENGETSSAEKTTTTTTTTTTTEPQQSKYIKLTYPCPAYTTITCGFGAYAGHTGCDFSTYGSVNQSIVAAESGIVIISTDLTNADGSYRSYGRYIVIRHDKTTPRGETVYTLYAHNNSRLVSEGQYVTKGQLIAKSGSTGNSTGPHCHFEVRVGGPNQYNAEDPAIYLP